ncbi:18302_t:CDS:2 [Rhizophagus irregularis]|nr:18302_t:CDS:2 [Rhizophagus irregularis]
MDYKFSPVIRKISLDRIQIPFFSNDTDFKILEFIKQLHKYRRILGKFHNTYEEEGSFRLIKRQRVVEFITQSSPRKKLKKKYQETEQLVNKPIPGRPRKLTPRHERIIIRKIMKNEGY